MTVSRAGHTALACHSVSSFTTTQCTDSQCVFVCVSPTDSSRNRCTYSLYCIQSFTATDCSPSHNVQAATTAFTEWRPTHWVWTATCVLLLVGLVSISAALVGRWSRVSKHWCSVSQHWLQAGEQ